MWFKLLRTKEHPPFPEGLSSEGRQFLAACFNKDPALRPSAAELLTFPFVTSHRVPGGRVAIASSKNRKSVDNQSRKSMESQPPTPMAPSSAENMSQNLSSVLNQQHATAEVNELHAQTKELSVAENVSKRHGARASALQPIQNLDSQTFNREPDRSIFSTPPQPYVPTGILAKRYASIHHLKVCTFSGEGLGEGLGETASAYEPPKSPHHSLSKAKILPE